MQSAIAGAEASSSTVTHANKKELAFMRILPRESKCSFVAAGSISFLDTQSMHRVRAVKSILLRVGRTLGRQARVAIGVAWDDS